MTVHWLLRMVAAQRGVWTGAELRRLLAERAGVELSSSSVSALLTKTPTQVRLSTLAALCTALGCSPNDLIEVEVPAKEGGGRSGGRTPPTRAPRKSGQPPSTES